MDLYKSGRQFVSNMWSTPAIKYHGLVNQGSTCYLNSVLQVLFMTKDFREAVERHISDNPDTEHIDLQLESLFGDLKSYSAYTYNITKKLGINKVYEQQDAAEYFEKILAKTSDDASKIFHGQLTHKTTCSSCGTETDAAGPFWNLTLALMASYSQNFSVVNGIEKYFRESSLNGENRMYCEKCDDKSDATTKCVINHHPEVLMLLLKRFEFDYYSMRYVKINCTVDVPCTLQIPENQPYELYAMVEHSGDLRSGHYIATIKSEDDGRWYSFNDSCVTELNSQPFQSDKVEKCSSAYLLFYRKEKVPAAGTQVFREESTPGGFPLSTCETQDQSEKRKREEDEGTAEEGKDAAATAFIDRDEETGIKDKARVKSIKSGLSPDISNVEDQGNRGSARPRYVLNVESKEEGNDFNVESKEEGNYFNVESKEEGNDFNVESKEEGNDLNAGKQRDEVKVNIDDEDDMRRNAGIRTSRDTSPEESVDDQHNDSVGVGDVGCGYNPGVSDRHLKKLDESRDAQRREWDVKTDKAGRDEQSEQRGTSLTKNLYMDTEHHGHEGLRNVKHDNLEGQQKMQQANGSNVDRQGDGLRTEQDVEVDKEVKTDPSPQIEDIRVDGQKQYMSEDYQGFEARRIREDRRDVEGAKEQKRGDDKHAQSTDTSMTQPYLCKGGEDQDKRGLDGVRQDRQQQKTSVPHLTPKDIDEERPADAQRREWDVKTDKTGRDEQSEQRGTSLTKKLYRDTEHHGHEGLGNVKHDNLEGQQKMWQANGPNVDQQGDGLRTEKDVEVDKEVKTDPSPLIEDRKVDGRKQNMSEECRGFEVRSRSRDRRQPREDRRSVEGAKEQKRGDDKHAQRTDTSMTKPYLWEGGEDQDKRGLDGVRQQKTSVPHLTPKDIDEERPADAQRRERDVKTDKTGRDEQSEQRGTSLTKKLYRDTEHHGHEGLRNVKHDNLEGQQKMWQAYSVDQRGDGLKVEKYVDVDKEGKTDPSPQIEDIRVDGRKQNMSEDYQGFEARRIREDSRQLREDRRSVEGAKEQKRGDDKHAQRTETSMREDQDKRGLDGVRQDRQQQKTSVPHLTPKDVDEERPAKEQGRRPFPNRGDSSHKQLIVKTVEEETKETPFGTQRSIETKIIGIKTSEKPAQQERLSECFSDMKLSEPQKQGTKRHIGSSYKGNVPTSAIDSNAEKKLKVSDTQEQAAENQHATKEIGEVQIKSRGHHAQQKKNGKGKKKKTTLCICKPWKRADPTSESE